MVSSGLGHPLMFLGLSGNKPMQLLFIVSAVIAITLLSNRYFSSRAGQMVCFLVIACAIKFVLPLAFMLLDSLQASGFPPLAIVFVHPIVIQIMYTSVYLFPSVVFGIFRISDPKARLWHIRNLAYGKTMIHFFLLAWYIDTTGEHCKDKNDVLMGYYHLMKKQSASDIAIGCLMFCGGLLLETISVHVKAGVRLKWLSKIGADPEIYPDDKRNVKHVGQILYHLSYIRLFGDPLRDIAYSWLLLYAFQTFIERENRKRKVFIHVAAMICLIANFVGVDKIKASLASLKC